MICHGCKREMTMEELKGQDSEGYLYCFRCWYDEEQETRELYQEGL